MGDPAADIAHTADFSADETLEVAALGDAVGSLFVALPEHLRVHDKLVGAMVLEVLEFLGVHGRGDAEALDSVVNPVLDAVDGDAAHPCGEGRFFVIEAADGTPGFHDGILGHVFDVLMGEEVLVAKLVGEGVRETRHGGERRGYEGVLLSSGKRKRRIHNSLV